MLRNVHRPSAAMVVASLALLVALGGTSYAAVLAVPRNSVGPVQLKRNAVGPSKIAPNAIRTTHVLNGSLLSEDFKAGQIPQGPKGDKGEKGDKGDKGDKGPPGLSGLQIVTVTASTASGYFGYAVATCPTGKRALGGGGGANAIVPQGPYVGFDRPTPDGTGWSVSTVSPVISSWTTVTYAVCASVS